MKKVIRRIVKWIVFIVGLILAIFMLNYLRINIRYYLEKKNYMESFDVAGNTNGYVPQGMAYDRTNNVVLQTSYNGDGEVSKLYVTDFRTNKLIKELSLKNTDNTDNKLHVGGVATNGTTVWITSDYQVNEFSLIDILTTNNNYIKSLKNSKLPIRGDFCYYKNNELWIGDFFLKPFYPVPDDTPLLFKYDIKNLDYNKPLLAISLPKMVQGMVITDNNEFIFTRSFTYLINSSLTTYKNVLNDKPDTYKLNNYEIPYYHFNRDNRIKNEKLPPMAEGLFIRNNELYILFENSSDHYSLALPRMSKVIIKALNN